MGSRLQQLESEILNHQTGLRSAKEELCCRAESLATSTDWKNAAQALKDLQQEWKTINSAGRDEETLWKRFRSAQDSFFERRKHHFEEQERQNQYHQSQKEILCSRAESLSASSDWKNTADALKQLQNEWKHIGYAGKEHDQRLWNRFRHAVDEFFERQAAYFDRKHREERENFHHKQALCSEAESLTHSDDHRAATQRVKELQQEWREIGRIPRDEAESLWRRFRGACDEVFENARLEHERKQQQWRDKMSEALTRKREQAARLRDSIEHDEGNIERWQEIIDNLHPGGRAEEIQADLESRISDVEARISSKRERLEDLEDSINDIESKLED